MRLVQKIPKSLVFLFSALFFAFLAWMMVRAQADSPQMPGVATAGTGADFTVHIPQKALWRNYVTVSIEADPRQECELTYIPPSGEVHQMDTTADEAGICTWKWKIEEAEGKGAGRLIFTIDGKSETHFFEIRSSF